jgi:hypothetical protein
MLAKCWMGCLMLLGLVGTAGADPKPGSIAQRIEDCEDLPEDAKTRYEAIGKNAVYGVAPSGEKVLVFPPHEGRDCEVFPMKKVAAKASGAFGAGAEVVAFQGPECGGGNCMIALAVGPKDGKPAAALSTHTSCDVSVALAPIKLFNGRDSIELVCRNGGGAGWKERRMLIDAAGGALASLYGVDTGSYIALSPEEKKQPGACPSRPVGSIRVEKVGDKPLLRVVDPSAGTLKDGKGMLPARQLGYDPKKRSFTPTGAPDIPTKVDARADCSKP